MRQSWRSTPTRPAPALAGWWASRSCSALATIDATADDKLTRFAIRLALSGHVGIPQENEFDFLAEAEAVFAPPQKKAVTRKTRNVPAAARPKTQPKKKAAKQQVAA